MIPKHLNKEQKYDKLVSLKVVIVMSKSKKKKILGKVFVWVCLLLFIVSSIGTIIAYYVNTR